MFSSQAGSGRTRRGLLAAFAALTLVGTAAACSSDDDSGSADRPAGAPKEIRIGYQAIPNGDLIVKHEGWLEEAFPGTKITWTKFDSGGDVNTAVVAGSIDIGLAGSSPVTRGLSAPMNIPYQVIWIHDVIGEAESLVARADSGITDVAGLAGRKVATPFASTAHYSLLAALKEAGVDPASVTLVDLEPPDILAAWQRGDIDAAYVWSPTLDELKKNGTVLATSAELAEAGYPTFDLAVVTRDFAEKYPAAVQEWLRQQNRAVKLLKDDPAAAAEAIAPELNLTAEEVTTQLKGLVFVDEAEQRSATYFGTPQEPGAFADGLLRAAEFLADQDRIDEVPTLQTLRDGIAVQLIADAFAG